MEVCIPVESWLQVFLGGKIWKRLSRIKNVLAPVGTCTTFTTGKPDIGLPPWLWLVETNTGSLDVLGLCSRPC